MEINFSATREDGQIITRIAKRYRSLVKQAGYKPRPQLDVEMDLTATHLNGCPMRLAELAEADDFNLAHDLGGIERHLDRETGKLGGCFHPRFHA